MKFIVDAQLPIRLSNLLNDLGADAIHTLDLPEKNRTGDDAIMNIATDKNRIEVTKDNDFLQSHLLKNIPHKLLLVNTENISNKILLELFTNNFPLLTSLFRNKDLVELTREEVIVHE